MERIVRANRKRNKSKTYSSQQQRVIRTDKDLDHSEYNTAKQQSHGDDVQVNNILISYTQKYLVKIRCVVSC